MCDIPIPRKLAAMAGRYKVNNTLFSCTVAPRKAIRRLMCVCALIFLIISAVRPCKIPQPFRELTQSGELFECNYILEFDQTRVKLTFVILCSVNSKLAVL